MPHTKEDVLEIYIDLKEKSGGTPLKYRDFLSVSGVKRRELERLFGASPYSKLQILAGDEPTKLKLEATDICDIMSSYGELGEEVLKSEKRLPVGADWIHRGLRPTEGGLSTIHDIRWSNFPTKFVEHCDSHPTFAAKFKTLIDFINQSTGLSSDTFKNKENSSLELFSEQIRSWTPALRRNSEEAYKSELSLFLRSQNPNENIREERSDSLCDIAVGTGLGIELKKAPTQSEYDRCFGQIARHLNSYNGVIVVIFDVPARDRFEDFGQLLDSYFPINVRLIQKG